LYATLEKQHATDSIYTDSPLRLNTDATLPCELKHSSYSYFTPHQNKQKCRKNGFWSVAALVIINSYRTGY